MLFYIFFFAFFTTIYLNLGRITNAYSMYISYKNLVDPQNKSGHLKTIRSLYDMFCAMYSPVQPKEESVTIASEKFDKNHIKIPYVYRDVKYYYLLKVPKGANPIEKIEDEDGNDISETIIPYLGPNLDCHGSSLTPIDFGYTKVTITTIFDKVIEFNEEDAISL